MSCLFLNFTHSHLFTGAQHQHALLQAAFGGKPDIASGMQTRNTTSALPLSMSIGLLPCLHLDIRRVASPGLALLLMLHALGHARLAV